MRTSPADIAFLMSRAPGVDMNPTTVVQRSAAFAATIANLGAATLLVHRTDMGLTGHLLTGHGSAAGQAAKLLAQSVGASSSETLPPELDANSVVGCLSVDPGSVVTRETQNGLDPAEVSRLLANIVPLDGWVAIVMRRPTKTERRRSKTWLAHRLGTSVPQHHSMSGEALVVSVFAGADTAAGTRTLLNQTAAILPGFDVPTRPRILSRLHASAPFFGAAAGVMGVAGGIEYATGFHPLMEAAIVATPVATFGALRAAGRVVPSDYARARRGVLTGGFPVPRGRSVSLPKLAARSDGKDAKPEPDYPLASNAFLVGPQVVVGVVAPQAGAMSGETATKSRAVPPTMMARIGPMIGDSEAGPVYLSAADAFAGVACLGSAGSGKSIAVRSLFAWACLDRVAPAGLPGFPGASNTLIAFESKDFHGAAQYKKWANAVGDVTVIIDSADTATPALDVFSVPGTVAERANFFVNALKYAFGETSIGPQSFSTLLSLLPAALVATPEVAGRVEGLNAHGSPVYFTYALLGGFGDDIGAGLARELAAESVRGVASDDLKTAVLAMAPLYGSGVTPAQRKKLQEAPSNKFKQLAEFEIWWTPTRRKVTWDQIIDGHRSVVINTGTSAHGKIVEEELSHQLSSILMYSLRHAIMRRCAGWQDQGRSVSIYSDELSMLAGHAPEVLTWVRDQGRAFGVRPVFATQRPEQLPDRVRNALLTFSTLISYKQDDVKTAKEVAENLSAGAGEWTSEDVMLLEPYTPAIRSSVGQRRQPAFTVKVRNFETDMTAFGAAQGYAPLATPAEAEYVSFDKPAAPAVAPLAPAVMVPAVDEVIEAPGVSNSEPAPTYTSVYDAAPVPTGDDDFPDPTPDSDGDLLSW